MRDLNGCSFLVLFRRDDGFKMSKMPETTFEDLSLADKVTTSPCLHWEKYQVEAKK